MRRRGLRVPGLSWRFLALHLIGGLAVLSGESFRAPAPTVEFAPAAQCAPATPCAPPAAVHPNEGSFAGLIPAPTSYLVTSHFFRCNLLAERPADDRTLATVG